MTDAQRKAILDVLRKDVREAQQQPEKARARLVRDGFYTKDGQLTERYGGKPGAR